MKIILTAVNAKYIHSNLAVYTLQASAEKAGVFPEIREFTEIAFGTYLHLLPYAIL